MKQVPRYKDFLCNYVNLNGRFFQPFFQQKDKKIGSCRSGVWQLPCIEQGIHGKAFSLGTYDGTWSTGKGRKNLNTDIMGLGNFYTAVMEDLSTVFDESEHLIVG